MGCLTIGLLLAIFATTSVLCTPTVVRQKNFNAVADARRLHHVLQVPGLTYEFVTGVLAFRSWKQRQLIREAFQHEYGEDLITRLEYYKNLWYGTAILDMMKPVAKLYLDRMENILPGDEWGYLDIIIPIADEITDEILQIEGVKDLTHEMKKFIGSELRDGGRFIVNLIDANSVKKIVSSATELVSHTVDNAKRLLVETDWASTFLGILESEGYAEIKLLYDEYKKYSKVGLFAMMEAHLSSEYYKKYKDIMIRATNKPLYFAIKLYDAMNGWGTDEDTLIRIIVGRSEIDLVEIKDAYKTHYGHSLAEDIRGDTSEDFMVLLLALLRAS